MNRSNACTLTLLLFGLACSDSADEDVEPEVQPDSTAAPAAVQYDWQRQIGIAVERDDKLCLRIRNPDLQPASTLLLITPGDSSRVTSGRVEKLITACPDELPADEFAYYTISAQDSLEMNARFFVVPHAGDLPAANAVDLDRDGVIERFRSCTSMEGVHYTVWSGKPLEGTRRWHYYYYLGYDVEPSCDARDTASADTTPATSTTSRL
jgi:hypothetical protein